MNYTKKNNLKLAQRSTYKTLNQNSRNKRKYAVTMLPGKNHEYSIPMTYLVRLKIQNMLQKQKKEIFSQKLVTIYNKYVQKKTPVGLLDLINIKKSEGVTESYLFYLKKENSKIVACLEKLEKEYRVYPIIKYKKTKVGYSAYTFQGKEFRILEKDLQKLKEFGAFVMESTGGIFISNIKSNSSFFNLIKLTGKDKFEHYEIKSISKFDKDHHVLELTDFKGKTKKVTLSKTDFLKMYTIKPKENFDIENLEKDE